MKTYITRSKGRIALAIDNATRSSKEKNFLAGLTFFDGTGCWHLVDIRLSRYRIPSPYSADVPAENYHACLRPELLVDRDYLKSILREFVEDADGTIRWCSFDGIVKGHSEVNGYSPVTYMGFNQAGYFSQAEGVDKLLEIKQFWDSYEGDPFKVRIENPYRQPSLSEVMGLLFERRLLQEMVEKRVLDISSLEHKAGAAYSLWQVACKAIAVANGVMAEVNWAEVDDCVIRTSIGENGQSREGVYEVLSKYSPGCVDISDCARVLRHIDEFSVERCANISVDLVNGTLISAQIP